jgi:hypothetical protein
MRGRAAIFTGIENVENTDVHRIALGVDMRKPS